MDTILMQSGITYNLQESTTRNLNILRDFLNILTSGNTSPFLETNNQTSKDQKEGFNIEFGSGNK